MSMILKKSLNFLSFHTFLVAKQKIQTSDPIQNAAREVHIKEMKKNDFGKFRKRDGIRREKRNDEKFKELTGRERDWSSSRRREKRRLQDFGGFVTYRDILEFF